MTWIIELLQRQSVPLVLSFIVIFPFVAQYLSTTLFYRTANSKAAGKRPPTIPFWLPGLYHAITLIARPSRYLAELIKDYGNHTPFTVRAGLLSYTVVREPSHVQNMLLASDHFVSNEYLAEFYAKVMGTTREATESYKKMQNNSEVSKHINIAHLDVPQKYLQGANLLPIVEIYTSIFRRNMSNKMFQLGTWTHIEDFWSFLQIEITRAMTETLFGSALLKQYPKLAQDLWKFHEYVENFFPGMPRFTVSSADSVRVRLHEGLKKWLQATHGGTDFAKIQDSDPAWDEDKGSKFIQERDQIFANIPSFNYKARAAEMLHILESSNSTVMPSTLWCIVDVHRNPSLVKDLSNVISRYYDAKLDKFDISTIMKLPIIESIHAEIGRLRTATRIIRTNSSGSLKLDDQWTLPKGRTVMTFSHDLGLNTEQWTKARPQTVARPLEEFWAQRFIVSSKAASVRAGKDGRVGIEPGSGSFDLTGLDGLYIPFDSGRQSCPGESFTKAIQASTLAVLLIEYEAQICYTEATEQALPPLREVAYGTIKPLDKIAMNIRKRTTNKASK